MRHLPLKYLRRVRRSTLGLLAGFLAVLVLWIAIRPAPAEVTQECNADTCVVTVRNPNKKPKDEPTVTPVPTATPVPRATPTPTPPPKPGKQSASPKPTGPAATPTAPSGDVGGLFAPPPQATPTPVPTATPAPVPAPLPATG